MLGEKSSGASPKCSYLAPNSSLLRWILNIFIDPAGPVQPVGEENVYQNNPRKNWLKFYDCVFVWVETCVGPPALAAIHLHLPPSLSPLPPRTNRKHSRPDHARAIKVEINIANTTFTAPRILARSCLSWNWFFVFKPKLVASLVAGLVAWLPGKI